jgi:hypothetical protein
MRLFVYLCALALSSMCETTMTPCEKLKAKIEDPATPAEQLDALVLEYSAHCEEGGDQQPSSGGHGHELPGHG